MFSWNDNATPVPASHLKCCGDVDQKDRDYCSGRFICGNGKSIPYEYKCDTEDNCADGSDEIGCGEYFIYFKNTVNVSF